MQVRGKIFPYPVINHNKAFTSFKDCDFSFNYIPEETDDAYILRNVKFETNSSSINDLIEKNIIGICIVVECSETVYRKAFELSKDTIDLTLPKKEFTERVDVSMFAYAKQQFRYEPVEVDEDYLGIDFEIDKYDILGAYDGFNIRFIHDETEDNLVQSIFAINISHDLEDGKYIVECNTGKKISITLSENDYKNYKIIYTVPTYMEVFFNMLLVPTLIEGLSLCKVMANDGKDLEDIGNAYNWFRSISTSYKKLKGIDLTDEDFKNLSPAVLAQELLGKPLGESLKKLVVETNKNVSEDDSND